MSISFPAIRHDFNHCPDGSHRVRQPCQSCTPNPDCGPPCNSPYNQASMPIDLTILISGGGRTLLNLEERIRAGTLDARIVNVISSRCDAAGVERARDANLPVTIVERRGASPDDFQSELTQAISDARLVCMAGFLSMWTIPKPMIGRVINIHPALLPDFGGPGMYGNRVHQAVLAAECSQSGCTVHFCDNQYDHGPTILQRRVPVLPDDTTETLAARIFEQECIAYPQAIELIAQNRVRLIDGRAVFIDGP